ncbi:phosphoenolpyruvate synthase [Candidatus Parcubacteria bacterium]|nr:phosphoenolpyruvate synthase [Candidatus Parcubacteria bacterium]
MKIHSTSPYIAWFTDISISDISTVGGKNASLGEMYSSLAKKGIRIPNGFAVTVDAYWAILRESGADKKIKLLLKDLDERDVKQLAIVGKKIRTLILKASLSKEVSDAITVAYAQLSKKRKQFAVAVRSSATAEDLPDASFAGQQESFLNVRGIADLLSAVKQCMASLFTDRAISYRAGNGYDHMSVALSVTVQEMVHSDTGSSGVMFTMDTESGFPGVVLINGSYGLGDYIVQGRVTPDQFYIFKEGVKKGKSSIISKMLGSKEVKLVYGNKTRVKHAVVKKSERDVFSLTDHDVIVLAKWGLIIEEYYGKPQDIEWVTDGKTGELFIVQARPETVKAASNHAVIETYNLHKEGKILLRGTAVGQRIGAGKVRVINNVKDMKTFKKGEVLVTRITDPDWEPIMRIASAVITEQGGKTSHAAIVSRELGVPAIVGTKSARKVLKTGQKVTASCAKGDDGIVYAGILPFEVKRTELTKIPETKTHIMMNVGDPDHAFSLSFLPHQGVGLARLEFIFTNFIRIHPLALIHYKTLKDKKAKVQIDELTRGYKDKSAYCVDKLAEGIARIATAMYPHKVVVRMSDFKSNEYATLIGGKEFEPKEQNPMIGWRGASRYYSDEYKPAFKLECEALVRVRDTWGLTNVVSMIPFCRTPEEGQKVLDTMKSFGLERGKNGLEVYVMCEIPSNVILAEDFAKLFDGFSIGTNDLTQLTLAVDRDSAEVSHIYDENNLAVKKLVKEVIRVAHKHKKHIGLCGQAPSDYPEFADFLVEQGIDSISLNPDTVVSMKKRVALLEKTLGNKGKKTNKAYLGIVAMLASVSAGIMFLGAGCANILPTQEAVTISNEITPADIRERASEKAVREMKDEYDDSTSMFTDASLGIQLSLPSSWQVQRFADGLMALGSQTHEFMTIMKKSGNLQGLSASSLIVAGKQALVSTVVDTQDGADIHVVQVPIDDTKFLEVQGKTDQFFSLLETLVFTDGQNDEARLCIQVVTYARENSEGVCTFFPTPCDVPDGWESCDI